MVFFLTITLYARQKKRHRCIQQTFGLYGRRQGLDNLREQHRNMYIIKCETDRQSRLDAWDKCLGLVHWDDPEGWDGERSGRGVQMGDTCKSMADSCQCIAKPLQYCKVISFQLIKIIGEKNHLKKIKKRKKKQKHYFADKGPSSQTTVFPIVMYGCKNQTIKKAEHWRIDAFEL